MHAPPSSGSCTFAALKRSYFIMCRPDDLLDRAIAQFEVARDLSQADKVYSSVSDPLFAFVGSQSSGPELPPLPSFSQLQFTQQEPDAAITLPPLPAEPPRGVVPAPTGKMRKRKYFERHGIPLRSW